MPVQTKAIARVFVIYMVLLRARLTPRPGRPVGSGKTALMLALCRKLRDQYSIAAVTNDIFTRYASLFPGMVGPLNPRGVSCLASRRQA